MDKEELALKLRCCVNGCKVANCPMIHDELVDSGPNSRVYWIRCLAHEAANVIDGFRWISVEDKLPEREEHVLVAVKVQSGSGYVCDAFYTAPKSRICMYWEDIDAEYDEETDEYYYPEGWWEVIKNWDDYGCVKIEDTVTHWMPLPSVPWKSF